MSRSSGNTAEGAGVSIIHEKRDALAPGDELVRHLEGDDPAEGRPAEHVEALRLDVPPYRLEVARGHLLDAGQGRRLAFDALRLQPVHGLRRVQAGGEIVVEVNVPSDRVHQEERPPGAGLDPHERRGQEARGRAPRQRGG